jgi:hypothetical protein
MMLINRFSSMLSKPTTLVLMLLLALGTVSCSGHGQGTVAPPIDEDAPSNLGAGFSGYSEGHNFLGAYTIRFDPVTWTAEVTPIRSADIHLNLSSYRFNENCPNGICLTWTVTGYDPYESNYRVQMTMTNPTQYAPYDMRVIFEALPFDEDLGVGWEVANPDSYTSIWDPDPEWDEDEQWLNPFIAFEKEDLERQVLADPDGNGPETYSDSELLLIHIPPDANAEGAIEVLIDGSWPGHCNEPYQVITMEQLGDLQPGTNDPDKAVDFEAVVGDWQADISGVSLYLPDIVDNDDDGWLEMDLVSDWPPVIEFPYDDEEIEFLKEYGNYKYDTLSKYTCTVVNDKEVPVGVYEGIVRAVSPDPSPQDYERMYNVYPFEVDIGGSGGTESERLIIVFSSYANDTDSDIYCYHFETHSLIRLTNDGGVASDELEVCVNQNATRIAFISNYDSITHELDDFELYTMDINYAGTVPLPANSDNKAQWTRVTGGPSEPLNYWDERMPDFHPNGTTLAYSSDETGQFEIYTIVPGSPATKHRVTYNYAIDEAPNYDRDAVPAGSWLFYQSTRAGGGNYEIYGIDPTDDEGAGNWPVRYTNNTAFDGYPTNRAGNPGTGLDPALAWTSDREGDPDIMFANLNTDEVVNLTHSDEDLDQDWFPSFSLDGQWIAFMSDRSNFNYDIWRMTWEGGNLTRMTTDEMPDIDPCYGGGI